MSCHAFKFLKTNSQLKLVFKHPHPIFLETIFKKVFLKTIFIKTQWIQTYLTDVWWNCLNFFIFLYSQNVSLTKEQCYRHAFDLFIYYDLEIYTQDFSHQIIVPTSITSWFVFNYKVVLPLKGTPFVFFVTIDFLSYVSSFV
jgi:hypothetical protein